MTHLPIVGYINPLVADALRAPTSGINATQLRAERNGPVSAPLVLKADADTEIAKRDAEIARLREHLTSCTVNLENVMTKMGDWCGENGPPEYLGPEEVMSALDAYETGKEALKGPEA